MCVYGETPSINRPNKIQPNMMFLTDNMQPFFQQMCDDVHCIDDADSYDPVWVYHERHV